MIGQAERQKEFALLLLLATLWGASYTFIKIGVETIPPITFIALRTLIAGGILLAVMRVRKLRMILGVFAMTASSRNTAAA